MSGLALLVTSPTLLASLLTAAPPAATPATGPATGPEPQVVPLIWNLSEADDPPSGPSASGQERASPPPQPIIGPQDDQPGNEIIVQGGYGPRANDPAQAINVISYEASAAVDRLVVQPVTYAYRDVVPEPIRDGLGNVVRNFGEPGNAINFLLQGKVGKAFGTLGRIAINSTIGIGGLIDVAAKPGIGIPYRRNGFANTMGYYGIGPGPYLFVPITGPTTVRDQIGVTLDQMLLPVVIGAPFNRPAYGFFYFAVNSLDSRLRDDGELAQIRASDNPYLARRSTYLARRRREIAELRGDPIPEPGDGTDRILSSAPPPPQIDLLEGLKRGPGAGDLGR
jgi:phospholipid-binding lipoprotein MlaA